jgi:hypothetical protein
MSDAAFLAAIDELAEPLWEREPYDPSDPYERPDNGWED